MVNDSASTTATRSTIALRPGVDLAQCELNGSLAVARAIEGFVG
jgi:hypothetical protein